MTATVENVRERWRGVDRAGSVAITLVFAAIVTWASLHHEPWRDEVVPLSIARQAGSLSELAAPLRFEGHPILWYLLLWLGWNAVGQTWVLKAASVGCAIGAVYLLNRSPLPWLLRILVTFSFFPLYQYSVISRGYSLEMLALFGFCALHPHRRERPVAVALVLAALANTEAFGFIMAAALVAMLLAESLREPSRWRSLLADPWVLGAVAVFAAGLAVAAIVAMPDAKHPLTGVRAIDVRAVAASVGSAIAYPVAHATQFAVVPYPSLWIWGYFLYLTKRPPLLCFAAFSLIGFEALFNLVYGPSAPWHVGNVVLVLVATLWLDAAASTAPIAMPALVERVRRGLGWVLAAGAIVMFAGQVRMAIGSIALDVEHDHSANGRLAEVLRAEPALRDAVVMGEPDTPLWSLSYYADNRIYMPRERTFRDWGMFSSDRPSAYDLGELLREARAVRAECECPVVITFGWNLGETGTHVNFPGTRFEESFTITAEQRADFLAAVQPLVRLRGPTLTDESFDVYVLP